jgi:uncharacterized membrane protein
MILRYGSFVITQAEYLYFAIPIFIVLFFIIRKKYFHDEHRLYKKPWKRLSVLAIRIFFILVLMLALGEPYIELKKEKSDVSRIKVLIDDSNSMQLHDVQEIEESISKIRDQGMALTIQRLPLGEYSSLGSSVLNNLAPEENILLVSDGQNNFGTSMEDVALFAASINSRLFSVRLENRKDDAQLSIDGPSKVVSGVENTFTVNVKEVGQVGRKDLKVYVDSQEIINQKYSGPVEIKRTFDSGNHLIKAVLDTDDYFSQNNEFSKAITVYEKPLVLFLSKAGSPLLELYTPFYDIEQMAALPESLDKYYAVVLDDIAGIPDKDIHRLEDYVSDGNGLFVVGGKNSYDWGDYNTSVISNILPVSVGKANKKKDVTNIVILMDTGASAGGNLTGDISYFDVQKALSVDILNSVSPTNKIGIIEANYYLNTLSGLSELGPKKTELITEISLLKPTGASELRFAYQKAHEMLRLVKGSKNIVIITDGNLVPQDQALTLNFVSQAYSDGIKTFIVGVGEKSDVNFLMAIKVLGGGEYFTVDEKNRLKIYFGDPNNQDATDLKLFVYDSNHFITKNVKELGNIYGFNTVYPKANSRLLLTTSTGDPILTIWNYGLGRVASLSTDDGSSWVPDLYSGKSSTVLIKTLNWLIEDPERKNSMIVDIPELREGEDSMITIRSAIPPDVAGYNFYETEKGIFKATLYANQTGFVNIAGVPAAVNYKKEYLYLGINPGFETVLKISGGEMLENDPNVIKERIQSVSSVESLKKVDLTWICLLTAIFIYLFELFVRRLFEIRQAQ